MKGFLTLALILVPLSLSAQAPPAPAPQPKIAAVINGEILTVEQLDHLYGQLNPQLRAEYERNGGKVQFLDTYIRKRLVVQEALKAGFDKRADVAFDIQGARDSALFDRYIRDVVAESILPESDILAYYEQSKETFKRPAMVKARHIIVTPGVGSVANTTGDNAKTPQEAIDKIAALAQQLRAHSSFTDLAMKYSEDGSAPSGGDLGWFERGKMVPAFDEAAFSLEKGHVSHVIETEFGYHLILVEDRKAEGIAPFSEVRREIRERLLQERSDKILGAVTVLTNELRGTSKISVNRENL